MNYNCYTLNGYDKDLVLLLIELFLEPTRPFVYLNKLLKESQLSSHSRVFDL